MHIQLIAPRMSLRPMDSELKRLMAPSLALLTLAALTPPEHHVTLSDENAAPLILDETADLVGITVNVDTSPRAYEIAAHCRQRGLPVILGGIHVSVNPDEALQHADAVCIGDAESVWSRILADAEQGRLAGRYENAEPVDLALAPRPRWELLDTSRYLYTNILYTSRNCPFRCDFCYNSCHYAPTHRQRPIRAVLDEIEQRGHRHVMFVDDNFIGNIPWTHELVRAIRPLGIKWNAAVSANISAHPDLLREMRDSGCQSLFIGLETLNPDSLRSMHKQPNRIERYAQLVSDIHALGIMINASLVFGFDQDRPEVFAETLDWLIAHKIETMTAHILTPYPGTRLYERLDAEGRITDRDWSHYNTAHVVFAPKHLQPHELYEGYLWIYREFYSWRNIARRLPGDRTQWMPYLLFNLGYRKFGKATSQLARWGLMQRLGSLAARLSYGLE